jgi:L-lysine exporter family protein LysE/ArgO
MGAVVASFIFFFSLGFGASLLMPLFRNEQSWRILDIFVGIVMWSIALSLILGNY